MNYYRRPAEQGSTELEGIGEYMLGPTLTKLLLRHSLHTEKKQNLRCKPNGLEMITLGLFPEYLSWAERCCPNLHPPPPAPPPPRPIVIPS
jgi:hypothetical protein